MGRPICDGHGRAGHRLSTGSSLQATAPARSARSSPTAGVPAVQQVVRPAWRRGRLNWSTTQGCAQDRGGWAWSTAHNLHDRSRNRRRPTSSRSFRPRSRLTGLAAGAHGCGGLHVRRSAHSRAGNRRLPQPTKTAEVPAPTKGWPTTCASADCRASLLTTGSLPHGQWCGVLVQRLRPCHDAAASA